MKYKYLDKNTKIIIDELGEEYKDLLVEKILKDTNEIDTESVKASDIIKVDLKTKSALRKHRIEPKIDILIYMMTVVGVLYSLSGFMMLTWNIIRNSHSRDTTLMISLTFMFIGLLASLVSIISKGLVDFRLRYFKNSNKQVSIYTIIEKSKEIEILARELVPKDKDLLFPEIIRYLENANIISSNDKKTIEKLFSLKNLILNTNPSKLDISQNELRDTISKIDLTIKNLKKIL